MYSTSSVWILNLECKVIRKKNQKLFLKHSLNLKMKHLVLFLQYFKKTLNDKKYDDFKPLENTHP